MKLLFKNYTILSQEESKTILELRNKDYIRLNMQNTESIEMQKHLEWIETLKDDMSKEYFALVLDEKIVGSCSWVRDEKDIITWGIYFAQTASPLVPSLSAYLFIEYLFKVKNNDTIKAYIRKENISAYKFNQHLGFILDTEDEIFYYVSLSKAQWLEQSTHRFITSLTKYLGKIEYEFQ
ncbi:MAG: GNAT family N-acetyltransferase [Sulfurimonadaceae bacterium]|jgi:UDP-4-amino-4,6-dideoxy-N-acetyl-beta-L-altrosamine N-acetyltransferase|nr:GNAT family N-acetyltransferase [Sulfurimonadaceae bacterium]